MVKLEGISEELVIEMREGKAMPPPPVDTTTGESWRPVQLALHRGSAVGTRPAKVVQVLWASQLISKLGLHGSSN